MESAPSLNDLGIIIGRTKGFLLTEQTAQQAVDGLAAVARDTIAHAEGAGVSLVQDGHRTSVGATDDYVLEADNLQYELGEGPCLTAWATGEPVLISDTSADPRWKNWTTAAAQAGVRACLSVPLIRGKDHIGAMKVYSRQSDNFDAHDQALLVNLAKAAAALLGHVQASDTPQRINNEMKDALSARNTIAFAGGILMARHSIGRHEALKELHALAKMNRISLNSQAESIINDQNDTARGNTSNAHGEP